MKYVYLLCLLASTIWISILLGRITSHYKYLTDVCLETQTKWEQMYNDAKNQ